MRALIPIVSVALLWATTVHSQATRKSAKPPDGTKTVSGRHFDVYVAKTEEKPMGAEGYTLKIWKVTAVARTLKHGIQRVGGRVETINSDLLDPASWEIVDFDGDGWDDYRFIAEVAKNGCRTWVAERWQPDHDRFTSAPKHARWSDARNKPLKKSCAGM